MLHYVINGRVRQSILKYMHGMRVGNDVIGTTRLYDMGYRGACSLIGERQLMARKLNQFGVNVIPVQSVRINSSSAKRV